MPAKKKAKKKVARKVAKRNTVQRKPKPGEPPRKRGRPPKKVDWHQVATLCALEPTHDEIAAVIGISVDTIHKHCKEDLGMNFSDFYREKRDAGNMSLRRTLFLEATQRNNTAAMIFACKNRLGMADRVEKKVEHAGKLEVEHSNKPEFEVLMSSPDAIAAMDDAIDGED